MPTLTATSAGFHIFSGIGAALSPYAFLRSATNHDGAVVHLAGTGEWLTVESLRYPSLAINVQAEFTGTGPTERDFRADVMVTAITFSRIDGNGQISIGILDLGTGVSVTAENQQMQSSIDWHFDLADSLASMIREEGFTFEGGRRDDHLTMDSSIVPIRGPVELNGHGGDDTLVGSLADDTIRGGSGDDSLSDSSGMNRLFGGAGHDEIELGASSRDSLAWGGSGHDSLISSNGSDSMFGGRGQDRLSGGRGNDRLFGNQSNDVIYGGEGNDVITGGHGSDVLSGGWGADTFVFSTRTRGWDRIEDFNPSEDHLRINGLTNATDNIVMRQSGRDVSIQWDVPGSGLIIENTTLANLTEDIFLF
ncbi:calcium-binding protein [Algicella marina]|uniref:Calcium-binding protein n=1 Tax=Algicella marina TaxID=2683284 RepID=A0A6P1SX27_9RHOB|nr:calcium-binding protein [Algicella marina]QHQ34998.1 hypothetical protein GO499_07205 [Algicella marina]